MQKIYQIQIALRNFRPKIWRRVLVPANLPLGDLHKIIQSSMGWYNEHLHQFVRGDTIYKPDVDEDLDFGFRYKYGNYEKAKISYLLKREKDKVRYDYDFGDDWEHDVILEKILPFDEKLTYPLCIKGKNACPPEDCGGVWGYFMMLEAIEDPKHEQHEEVIEWIGKDFDPKGFNIDEVNELLHSKDYGCAGWY